MGTYVKATGDLVTVRPKKTSAANQGRMLLDDALIEMLDIMLPVGELKTFSTDQVDSWIAKMAEYGQEWMVPEGQLLKVADYPELFALIGYNYGWSDANPNTTYTYTFTDVNGASKSLTLYNDLDIDGNAKAVSGSPAYFRLPNYSGRFLRCAGTATYANKWTDTDGNERQLLTTYTAKMYKGKLDAQRGIRGRHNARGIRGRHNAQTYLTELENFGTDGSGKGCFEKMTVPGVGHYWGRFSPMEIENIILVLFLILPW